jgi:hypothetical protein
MGVGFVRETQLAALLARGILTPCSTRMNARAQQDLVRDHVDVLLRLDQHVLGANGAEHVVEHRARHTCAAIFCRDRGCSACVSALGRDSASSVDVLDVHRRR